MILQVFGPIAASEGLRRAGEYPEDLNQDDDLYCLETSSTPTSNSHENNSSNDKVSENSADEANEDC